MSDLGNAVLTTEVDLSGLEGGLGEAETQTQGRMASMAEGLKGSLGLAFAGIGVALAGALAGAGVAAFSVAQDFETAQNQMQAQLGVTAEEAQALGDVARDVFGNNFGESVADVGESIIEVRQQMKGLADDELQGATEAALSLRDVFGLEVAESTNAANTLMENFGLTSQQAFDFITKGQQSGLNASGDFLDTIGEYSTQFANGGASADQFFSLMESGLQGGVLGTDKAADAFKEFGLRIADGSESSREALAGLGIDADDLWERMASGETTTADAFASVIEGLNGIEDPVARNAIGVALLGTQYEDMGASAVLGLDLATTSMADMAGATDSLGVQYNNLGSVWEGVSRGFLLALEPLGVLLLDLANMAMPYLLAAAEQLRAGIEVAIGFIGPFVQGVVSFLTGLFQGEGTTSLNSWGAAFQQAQALIAGVMAAIQGIIGPILATLSAFWAQHGAEIVAFATQAWNQIGSIVAGVLEILNATIIPILTAIGSFIGEHSDEIMAVLTAAWTVIETTVGTTLRNVQGVVNAVLAALRGDWGTAWAEIQGIADRSIKAVQTVIGAVLSAIQGVWGSTLSGLQSTAAGIWDGIKSKVSESLNGAKSTIESVLGGFKGVFESNLNGVVSYVEGLPGRFASAGSAMIDSLRDGIMGKIGQLIEDAKAALAKLTNLLPGSEPKDHTSPLYGLGRRGEALAANFMDPAIAALEGMTLRPALAGIAGQLDAAMGGPLAGGASAQAQADVSVRLNEGGLRGLIDVQVDKRLNATGRDAATRRRTGG